MTTDTGVNLLDPGKTPAENIQFLVFLMAVVTAVDNYADLMRLSVASAGNDHRLGANEAPPAIISIFLGDELTAVLDSIENDTFFGNRQKVAMEIGATVLPHFYKDTTDRNRTSPFAFTGNKFEFRSLGSSLSVSGPNVVLNTAVAEALSEFYEVLKDVPAEKMDETVHGLLKEAIKKHKRVIFNGNGYTDEWIAEAEKRGLYNYKSTPDVLPVFVEDKNVKLFTKHHIFTESEIKSRYEILLENYSKTIHIEAKTMLDMVNHQFMPALLETLDKALTVAAKKKKVCESISCKTETAIIEKLSASYDAIYDAVQALAEDTEKVESMSDELAAAKFYQATILEDMSKLRALADAAEEMIPDGVLPYPSYADILFYV